MALREGCPGFVFVPFAFHVFSSEGWRGRKGYHTPSPNPNSSAASSKLVHFGRGLHLRVVARRGWASLQRKDGKNQSQYTRRMKSGGRSLVALWSSVMFEVPTVHEDKVSAQNPRYGFLCYPSFESCLLGSVPRPSCGFREAKKLDLYLTHLASAEPRNDRLSRGAVDSEQQAGLVRESRERHHQVQA